MALHRLIELTFPQVDSMHRRRTVPVLPVGAIEAHGPHLPLGTDGMIAESMAAAAALLLEESGLDVLLLPALVYTPAPFAQGFAGTISASAGGLTDLVTEVATRLASWGFETMGWANCHLDPAHLQALHEAERRIAAAGAPRVAFPDLTRKPWALRLTDEFRTGACHAGQYESSILLALRPELVQQALMRTLPPHPVSLSEAIRQGKQRFEDAGGEQAYFGAPAEATAAEGWETIASLGEILAESVLETHSKS